MKNKIHKIVITGGPCAGKTTAMAYLKRKLEEKGYFVLIVPEAATLCINGGINPGLDVINGSILQKAIIGSGYDLEERWCAVAEKVAEKKDVVILYDRGIPDSQAYTSLPAYAGFLKKEELNYLHVRDSRYDAVIHLRTTAIGAEDFYTLSNNSARSETPEQARELDQKTQDAWTGHPHLRIVDNSTDFDGKLHRAYQEVCAVLGIPVPIERERKFLVKIDDRSNLPDGAQPIEIEQAYLVTPDPKVEVRVRRRGQDGYFTYYRTRKEDHGPGERLEIEEIISRREYDFGYSMKKTDSEPVRKTRTCFVHGSQYFELDKFEDPRALPGADDLLLEIELTREDQEVDIPGWITVDREVTDDSDFSNANIAKRLATA